MKIDNLQIRVDQIISRTKFEWTVAPTIILYGTKILSPHTRNYGLTRCIQEMEQFTLSGNDKYFSIWERRTLRLCESKQLTSTIIPYHFHVSCTITVSVLCQRTHLKDATCTVRMGNSCSQSRLQMGLTHFRFRQKQVSPKHCYEMPTHIPSGISFQVVLGKRG